MARVDFAYIRAHANFRDVLEHYNLVKSGGARREQVKVHCPFHEDREPSLSINTKAGVFNCFGCGAGGTIIDFVARMESCETRAAAIRLAEIAGIETSGSEDRQEAPSSDAETLNGSKTTDETSLKAHDAPGGSEAASGASAETPNPVLRPPAFPLKLDPNHPYLKDRLSEDEIRAFGLGFCARGMMAGRIAIPIHDRQGELVAYAGRWPSDEVPEGQEKYRLPPRFRKGLELFNFHRAAALQSGWVVIVEGYFGAIRLHSLDVPCVSVMGSSVSDEQIVLLRRWSSLTVLFDGDEPGREAGDRAVLQLAEHFFVNVGRLPDGEQPDTVDHETLGAILGSW